MNNPIQERIEQLLQKWTDAINLPDIKLVRILAKHDEKEMINTFFKYMLALDTDQEDFVWILEAPYTNYDTYGRDLLEEMEAEIGRWNEAEKPESIPLGEIEWQPDYTLGDANNVTQLFAENLNNFANYLIPDQDTKVSIILRMPQANRQQACSWLNELLEAPTEPHIVFGVSDTTSYRMFDKLRPKKKIHTIVPDLNMDEAMEQLAALGDPQASDTPYRIALVKLMNAVKNREKKETVTHAKTCLDIATKGLKKDLNWLMQIVTVYTILYNDQVGYKKYDKAIYYADKAVETSLLTQNALDPNMAYRLIGQTHTGRGALFSLKKKWIQALEDYDMANKAYTECNDHLMQSETFRLCGWSCEKLGNQSKALEYYMQAYPLIHKLSHDVVRGSTIPFILKKLMDSSERAKHISNKQMDEDLVPIFGETWRAEVRKYGKANYQPIHSEQMA